MPINQRCINCEEPTKFVVGFYDGSREKHGCLFDCKNSSCPVNQIFRSTESKNIQKRMQIQELNGKHGMYAGEIAVLRRNAKITIRQMSQIAECTPAEYSAYEHERKSFDPEVYKKCKTYLSNVLERGNRNENVSKGN